MDFNIRHYTEEDIPAIYTMARNFAEASNLGGRIDFNDDDLLRFLDGWQQYDTAIILVCEVENEVVGFIAGSLMPHFLNKDCIIANEMAWWVNPGYRKGLGKKLLQAFESWARDNNASRIVVSSTIDPENSFLDAFYKKYGYMVSEISYMKSL